MTTTTTTTGLLAVFADLEPEHRSEFREFLAEDMFPPRAAIGFGPGGSFDRVDGQGSGNAQQFVTLYETPSVSDLYGAPYQDLRKHRAPRDALFHQLFRNQDRYTCALAGTDLDADPGKLADLLWIDRFDLADDQIQAFNIWYETVYLPGLTCMDGIIRARRYMAMEGSPKHLIIHQFTDAAILKSADWRSLREDPAWSACEVWPRAPALYEKVISTPGD